MDEVGGIWEKNYNDLITPIPILGITTYAYGHYQIKNE